MYEQLKTNRNNTILVINDHQYIKKGRSFSDGSQVFRCRFKDECNSFLRMNSDLTVILSRPTLHTHLPKLSSLQKTKNEPTQEFSRRKPYGSNQ